MSNSLYYSSFLLVFFELLLLVIADKNIGDLSVAPNLIAIPSNNGLWSVCSETPTGYASYSVRVSNDTISPVNTTFGKTSQASPPDNPSDATGFFVSLDDATNIQATGQSTDFVAALSCYDPGSPNQICDNDGQTPKISNYCIVIVNPSLLEQRASVAVSFTSSVFVSPPQANVSTSTTPPSPTETPTDQPTDEGKDGLSPWIYALIAAGVLTMAAGAGAFFLIRRRRRNSYSGSFVNYQDKETDPPSLTSYSPQNSPRPHELYMRPTRPGDAYLDPNYSADPTYRTQPEDPYTHKNYTTRPDDPYTNTNRSEDIYAHPSHEPGQYRRYSDNYSFTESQTSIPGSPPVVHNLPPGRSNENTYSDSLRPNIPQPPRGTSPHSGSSGSTPQRDNLAMRVNTPQESPNPPNRQLQTHHHHSSSEPGDYLSAPGLSHSASQESFREPITSHGPSHQSTERPYSPPRAPQQNTDPDTQAPGVFRFPSVRRPWRSGANANPRDTQRDNNTTEFGGAY